MPDAPTVAELLSRARSLGVDRLDAQCLLAFALSRSRSWLLAHGDARVAAADVGTLWPLLQRRAAGEPLAYLVGEREFHGLKLHVNPDVLVPRSDTETLVDWAIELMAAEDRPLVVDLGTGSGAIALALKQACPQADVHASDNSAAALALARDNGSRLGLRVSWHLGDWWHALADSPARRFDLAVANPPYIAVGDPHLAALCHEPRVALVPSGDAADGLADLERLIRGAPRHLHPGGWLLLEHGFDQGAAVRQRLQASGFCELETRADLGGRARVTGGRSPGAAAWL